MQSSHASTCVFKLVAPTVRRSSVRPSVRPSPHTYYPRVRGRTYARRGGRRTRGVCEPACIQIKLPEKLLISGPIATGPFISGPRASLSARNSLNIGRSRAKPPPRIPRTSRSRDSLEGGKSRLGDVSFSLFPSWKFAPNHFSHS